MQTPDLAAIAALEERVDRALRSGDSGELTVLGYGEISSVLALEDRGVAYACKRLPPFRDRVTLEAYRVVFEDYVAALAGSGVRVAPTSIVAVERADGRQGVYCVQRVLPPEALLTAVLARTSETEARVVFAKLVTAALAAAGPRLGLDGQVSNWALVDGELVYFDVTTPMLRDGTGRERLDTDLFIASLPWAVRGLVRRFALGQILDKYYVPRGVVLDALANLVKEKLDRLLPALLEVANGRVTPAITEDDVRRYYASDAQMWELLQRLRRLDRAWQRRVRRRPYPFLLPAEIVRR